MSKTKNYYWDQAEKKVDEIITNLKNKVIDYDTARTSILNVEAVNLVDIDFDNVDEVIAEELK
mgnify:CR=1 FL=1|jgi:hypothetical protein|tara:strand:+ start:81 stop:269 length:189 start_codon:yes stop_codon:yes gene_type:complete